MNYPLISEYIEAIKSAEDNFKELINLRPVLGYDGLPIMNVGGFSVVFKMKDERDGKFYALKCFIREQEGRAEAYKQITEELKNVESSYLVSIHYYDRELFVDTEQTTETEFPVLLMDWVEGKTLGEYLRENLDDKFALEMLAYRFSQLAQWLIPQPFAHGDLKPDNILVREDGSLALVDYDGMYVPAMKGQKARELGSPDFRHPLRAENDFNENIDEFPLVSTMISLKAISLNSELFEEYCTSNHLLFSEIDYKNVNDSVVFKTLISFSDIEINKLIVAFLHHIMNSANARYPIIASLNSNYSPEKTKYRDIYYSPNKYVDEFGVEYTPDRKILLRWHEIQKGKTDFPAFYRVPEDTEIICDEAFMFCKNLTSIYLPKSLKHIGKSVFVGTRLSSIECESSMFLVDDNILFSYDKRVLYYYPEKKGDTYFDVPEQVKLIVPGCFDTANYLRIIKFKHIYYDFDSLLSSNTYISIPKGAKKHISISSKTPTSTDEKFLDRDVRYNIFEGDLVVDNDVVYSSDRTILYRFPFWLDYEEYRINENCKIIEEAAFDDSIGYDEEWGNNIQFNKLKVIYLPNGLEEIKDYAFVGCGLIENITIPQSVKSIGNYVFGQCVNLLTLTFLSKIEQFGEKAFHIGKTISAPLKNPYVPYVELSWKVNEIDIIICPKGTENYYKEKLDNVNSLIYSLNKDETFLKFENPNHLNDRNYFIMPPNDLQTITTPQLKEKLSGVVCKKSYGLAGEGIGIDLSKLECFLGETVFNVNKPTFRFFYRHNLLGICYLTKNYRSRFISDDDSFNTEKDAIDFACRVYYDVHGCVLDLDIE